MCFFVSFVQVLEIRAGGDIDTVWAIRRKRCVPLSEFLGVRVMVFWGEYVRSARGICEDGGA